MTSRYTVITFGNVIVILVCLLEYINVSLMPRAFYGLPVFFSVRFVELFFGNWSVCQFVNLLCILLSFTLQPYVNQLTTATLVGFSQIDVPHK